ncbi:MAG TPA: class I SAM-dependent methyltransferase [Lachnospiraceae bacterium]|nr:class I SAM-dependent methyltransferase [Lachnospiraceae bacterium]
MEAYSDFAYVYDTFMDETPYAQWCSFVEQIIAQYGISKPIAGKHSLQEDVLESERNLVVDLGCGTGTLTEMLSEAGYDMIGIDNSQDMLDIAMEKKLSSGQEILYLLQDMRSFELYSTVGTVLSVCDSLNYILSEEELLQVFRLVSNYLFPGGIFIFDFNTVYKYAQVIGDTTIAENRDECSFIWDNYYHEEEQINEYEVTVFVKKDEDEDCFRKFSETHYQKGYTVEQMKRLVEEAGLHAELILDADTHQEVSETSERVYVVAKSRKKMI